MMMRAAVTKWAPLIPFAAVVVGLNVLKSAWLVFLLYHLAIVAVAVMTGRHRRLSELVTGWRTAIGFGAIALGIIGGGLLWLLWPRLGVGPELASNLAAVGLTGAAWTVFVAYHVLVNPWLEELFWRGILGSGGRRISLCDVAFGGYHLLVLARFVDWPWLIPAFVVLTTAAWMWRQITRVTGGLLVAVLSHTAGDLCVFLAIVLHLM